jgi:hypothetical protein
MTSLGNICVGIALLIFLVPLQLMVREPAARGGDGGGGIIWGSIFVLVPLWFLLTVALCAATARGALDWLTRVRALQYLVVLAACVAMAVVTFFSMALKHEPMSQVPGAARPFLGWAVLVFPPIVMGFCVLALDPGLASAVPAPTYRIPAALVGAACLLASGGLLWQWFSFTQQEAAARVERMVARDTERDREMLAEVERLDPVKELGRLLDKTGPFESPAIRELAVKKARSHPSFSAELAAMLQNEWCIETLTFLEANDPPEAAALAEPARVAMLRVAKKVRKDMEEAHHLYDDSFDSHARRVMAVADRLRGHGVDYSPAIREFRAALDTPRSQKIDPSCRRALDQWLARNAK